MLLLMQIFALATGDSEETVATRLMRTVQPLMVSILSVAVIPQIT